VLIKLAKLRLLTFLQTGKFKPEKVTTLVANCDDAPRVLLERTTKVVVKPELNRGKAC